MGKRAKARLTLALLAAVGGLAPAARAEGPFRSAGRAMLPRESFPSAREFFDPLLADPTELGYGGRHVLRVGGDRFGEVSIGDYVGLFRWSLGGGRWLQVNFGGGAMARFNLSTRRNNLEVVDFTAAAPVDVRLAAGHTLRASWRHTSSHLGDDYIDREKAAVVKRAFDSLGGLYAYAPWATVRLYGGGSYAINKVNQEGRGGLQAGAEWLGEGLAGRRVRPFVAQDFHWWERVAWRPAWTLRVGLRFWDAKGVAAARAFVEYFTGRMTYLQFENRRESRWTFGLNFEVGNPVR